jgi:hypothetical protein
MYPWIYPYVVDVPKALHRKHTLPHNGKSVNREAYRAFDHRIRAPLDYRDSIEQVLFRYLLCL